MASAKTSKTDAQIANWRSDLVDGTPKKRENAAMHLAALDPEGTRATLLELFGPAKKGTRRVIARCLHWVADSETAETLLADETVAFDPARISTAILATLYDDLRGELPTLKEKRARRTVERLGLLDANVSYEVVEARERWKTAARALLLALLDDDRFVERRHDISAGLRRLAQPRASLALIERWGADPSIAKAFDVFAAWMHLGDDAPAGHASKILRAFTTELETDPPAARSDRPSEAEAQLDEELAAQTSRIPDDIARDLVVALVRSRLHPKLTSALGEAIVERTHTSGALVALLDHEELGPCHGPAALRLIADKTGAGAQAVIARGDRLDPKVLRLAVKDLRPSDAFDLLHAGSATPTGQRWYAALVDTPAALRDARWLEVLDGLPERGRAMLVAIARDPRTPSRAHAVGALARAALAANGRLEKRAAFYALGQTGHPDATIPLADALADPDFRDGAPLLCTALGDCGDTRAIPILEKRSRGPYKEFIDSAILHIRERVQGIYEDALLAAVQDDDPILADLARRAQEGEHEAAVVLEDALRERGRL